MSLKDNKNESERLKTVPAFLFLKIFLKLLLTPSLLCVILSLRLNNKHDLFFVFGHKNVLSIILYTEQEIVLCFVRC